MSRGFFAGDGRWAVVDRTHARLTDISVRYLHKNSFHCQIRVNPAVAYRNIGNRRHRQPARHGAPTSMIGQFRAASLLFVHGAARKLYRGYQHGGNLGCATCRSTFRCIARNCSSGHCQIQLQKAGLVVLELKVQLQEDANPEGKGPSGVTRSTHAACTVRSWQRLSRRSRPPFELPATSPGVEPLPSPPISNPTPTAGTSPCPTGAATRCSPMRLT